MSKEELVKSRVYGRLTIGVSVFALVLISSSLFSLAQLGPRGGVPANPPGSPAIPVQARVPHSVCADCFTVADALGNSRYDVFEEVPETGQIIKRSLPNPAPLEPDEERLEFDPRLAFRFGILAVSRTLGRPIWSLFRQSTRDL